MVQGDAQRQEIHQWMVRLADGDRTVFPQLFETLWPILQSFSRRLVGQPQDAEDAAQQALLNVFRRASEFDPSRDALSWIFGITAYECKTTARRRARRKEESAPAQLWENLLQNPRSTEQELIQANLLAVAEEVLGDLKPADTETILAAFGNLPRPDISPSAFRKRLERAIKRLRMAWRLKIDSP